MKLKLAGAAVGALMLAMAVPAAAEGELQHLQLGRLHQPGNDQEIRREIQDQGYGHGL